MLQKQDVKLGTGLNWLRTGPGGLLKAGNFVTDEMPVVVVLDQRKV